jgi:hypothetical protein
MRHSLMQMEIQLFCFQVLHPLQQPLLRQTEHQFQCQVMHPLQQPLNRLLPRAKQMWTLKI